MKKINLLALVFLLVVASGKVMSSVVLYDQDFEKPNGYLNGKGDASQQLVNSLYGDQPLGCSGQVKLATVLYSSQ